uniref:Uncharacterized protein n=1 Tax=Arundo donax TaxID=35708 RepID=A0A0A9AHU8_ARUDO
MGYYYGTTTNHVETRSQLTALSFHSLHTIHT